MTWSYKPQGCALVWNGLVRPVKVEQNALSTLADTRRMTRKRLVAESYGCRSAKEWIFRRKLGGPKMALVEHETLNTYQANCD